MMAFLFSCEYATCAVPEAYRELFKGAEEIVTSADGWDSGALNLAQSFSMRFRTPLVHGLYTRLLFDLDAAGDARWSRFSNKIPEAGRQRLVDREDAAYRISLRQRIAEDLRRHPSMLHLRVRTVAADEGQVVLESFVDGGLGEALAAAWRGQLSGLGLDVSHQRGVTGSALAAELAALFPAERYGLMRIKVAQSFFLEGRPWRWEALKKALLDSLVAVTAEG
ncbi:MAG: hypothetical protein NTW21_34460 [Verrucomicrobia bacterium]|nr:hypothetical protein [Verrucomicrobiota bacterium]